MLPELDEIEILTSGTTQYDDNGAQHRAVRYFPGVTMPSEAHDGVVAMLRANASNSTGEGTFESSRENLDATGSLFSVAENVEVLPTTIEGVLCERLRPGGVESGAPRTRILYLHGGSYTAGSLASHRSLASRIAVVCGAEVVTAHYGLAPEHPYPEGINDAQA
ncbi:MAG: alpha/beta hydrolase fold domain-containing protein, partial [Actinomycetota bacterium]